MRNKPPPDPDALVTYPYIVLRLACRRCDRRRAYRLARVAARFGADCAMPDVLAGLTADCYHRRPRHPIHGECQAYLPDLEPPRRPPDLPAALAEPVLPRFRVVGDGR